MKFVISAAFAPVEELFDIARTAEECGFEAMTFSDHVVYTETIDTPYPYTEDGTRRYDETSSFPDPWVTIGALAASTTTLRFTTNVYVLAMRNPFAAAKMIGTAALLSDNRVTLTVGVCWSNVEFEVMGQPFKRRGKRTDEMLELMQKLWTGEMVEHHGEFYDCPPLLLNPVPNERIPVWVGGFSEPALRRAARQDGWLSDMQTTAHITECIEKCRKFRAEAGRADEPFDVMASASDAFDVEGYTKLSAAGVTHVLTMPWAFYSGVGATLQQKVDGIRRYADDVIAKMP